MPAPVPRSRSRLSRVYHRLSFALGLGVTVWVVMGYIATRMKSARIKLVQDRQRADRVKQHFTSTMSNITFTIYALIPTLSSQVLSKLAVEDLTEKLQHLAGRPKDSGVPPSLPTTTGTSRASTSVSVSVSASSTTSESDFQHRDEGHIGSGTAEQARGIGSSWASEFVASSSSSSSAHPDNRLDLPEQDPPAIPQPSSLSTFDTPSSNYDTLHSQSDMEVETGTDMSTSMSNITDPSPGSSSSPEDDDDVGDGQGQDDERSPEAGIGGKREEERYLRSPSLSPRRARRGLPREHKEGEGERDGDRTFHTPGAQTQTQTHGEAVSTPGNRQEVGQGSSYADVTRSGSGPGSGTGEEKRDEPGVETGRTKQEQGKTKAHLWGEIKVQAITRTILTLYLVPLLTIQTTSQLTLLARLHHLRNLAEATTSEGMAEDDAAVVGTERSGAGKTEGGLMGLLTPWTYFSGTGPTSTGSSGGFAAGLWSIGSSTASYLLGSSTGSGSTTPRTPSGMTGVARPLHTRLDVEIERKFLCFSWWMLHVGWQELEEKVRDAVVQVFRPVGLKKELTVADWLRLVDDVKIKVDTAIGSGFHDLLCPPADPAEFERLLSKHGLQHSCPIPMPPYNGPLAELLDQTSAHARSADFTYLLSTCYDRMKRTCMDQFASKVYDEIVLLDPADQDPGFETYDTAHVESTNTKRLVECLPFLTTWSRDVWVRVPDEAVERTLGLSEVEGFATLIYADFASGL